MAIKYQLKTTKHTRLIGWFNKTFVKENVIDGKYGKLIRKAFENRMESDYDILSDFSREEVLLSFEEMKDVITELQKLIR